MATVLLNAITADLNVPGGTSDLEIVEFDVSPYREIRGFFGKRGGPEVTITIQLIDPSGHHKGDVIGVLDAFTVEEGEPFSRSWNTPGLTLRVLVSVGAGGGAHLEYLAFVAWES